MSYKSQFTGAEADKAIGEVLGNEYGNDVNPGCKQIGLTEDLRQDLNQVIIPGLYTVFFYYNGPEELETMSPSPIRMRVYWEGSKEIQWILYHTDVYYRDIQTTTKWTKVPLAAKEIEIIDNLSSDKVNAALSANMGRYLKQYIDGRVIGGPNLITNSSFNYPYDAERGWLWSKTTGADGVITWNTRISSVVMHNQFKTNVGAVDIISNSAENPSVYLTTDPAFMPSSMESACVYTASVYLYSASGFTSVDETVNKKYIDVILQVSLLNDSGDGYLEQSTATNYRIYEDDVDNSGRLNVRIINTFKHELKVSAKLYVSIGLITNGTVTIYAPKLEYGHYATAWSQSYMDQYDEFINAKRFHGIETQSPSDRALKQQSGYRYDIDKSQFVLDELAVGGGGGFVSGNTEPTEHQCLWFDTSDYGGYSKRYIPGIGWMRIPISSIIRSETAPADTSKWWLDPTNETDVIAASLKYYDEARKIWRLPVTAPTKCFVIQSTPPENNGLIWIHSDTHIPRVYDETKSDWIIMHAAWGENRVEPTPVTPTTENLFPYHKYDASTTNAGITLINNNDGTFTLSGSRLESDDASNPINFATGFGQPEVSKKFTPGTYKFSGGASSEDDNRECIVTGMNVNTEFIITEDDLSNSSYNFQFGIRIPAGKDAYNGTITPVLEKVSDSTT